MPRKSNKNFVRLPFSASLALSTLNDNIVLKTLPIPAITEDLRVLSMDCTWTLRDLTAGEGPLEVGYADDNYSVTEIAENLIAQPSGPGDRIQVERSERRVRRIGKFTGQNAAETLNDGKPIKTRLNWLVTDDSTLACWIQNQSDANMMTGAILDISGYINAVWAI